ncbi:MAG: alkaline phosphatase family protein [Oceanidesulfovibrio sp.]
MDAKRIIPHDRSAGNVRRRLVVLGLDGLGMAMARRLAALPGFGNLDRLAKTARTMDAELPELSPVNWTSFATAAGPGTHGVYGFTRIDARSYEISVGDARQVQSPTIFDRLGGRGLVSRVVNLPHAWPAKAIHGSLVAGFVAPDLERAVHPPSLAAILAEEGYLIEADTTRGADDLDYLLAQLRKTLACRTRLLERFWHGLDWDLFVFVLTETDRLFHFFHPAVEEQDHPLHGACIELLREWDRAIGLVLERYDALPQPKRLLALADHGFATLDVECDMNAWLREHGWLDTEPAGPNFELDGSCILPTAKAFALDPARIYMNRASRFARGSLSDAEADRLAGEIAEALGHLTWRGEPVMERVCRGADLYVGPAADRAPDLVCVPRVGVDLKAKFDRPHVFAWYGRTGMHTAHDVFFHDSHGAAPERVRDVGREVLRWWGIPMDGPDSAADHAVVSPIL